jgi:hypothetical protein
LQAICEFISIQLFVIYILNQKLLKLQLAKNAYKRMQFQRYLWYFYIRLTLSTKINIEPSKTFTVIKFPPNERIHKRKKKDYSVKCVFHIFFLIQILHLSFFFHLNSLHSKMGKMVLLQFILVS